MSESNNKDANSHLFNNNLNGNGNHTNGFSNINGYSNQNGNSNNLTSILSKNSNNQSALFNKRNSNYINNNNPDVYEISRMLINYIRKLKRKLIRDNTYLISLNSRDPNRYAFNNNDNNINKTSYLQDINYIKKPYSSNAFSNRNKIRSEQANENKKRIEEIFNIQTQENKKKFKQKLEKRSKIHDIHIKEQLDKYKERKDKNNEKNIKSKMYFEYLDQLHDNKYNEYISKDKKVRTKVYEIIQRKRDNLKEKARDHQNKIIEANHRHLSNLIEAEVSAEQAYRENLKKSFSVFNNNENLIYNKKTWEYMPKINHLDRLLETGKFDRIKTNQFKKTNDIKNKLNQKSQKYNYLLNKRKKIRQEELLKRSLAFEDKLIQVKRNQRANDYYTQKKNIEILNKDKKIKANVKEIKDNCSQKLFIKNKIDDIKNKIKFKLEKLLEDKHLLNSNDLRNCLYQVIPDAFLENRYITDEIELACNDIRNIDNSNYCKTNQTGIPKNIIKEQNNLINCDKKILTYYNPIDDNQENVISGLVDINNKAINNEIKSYNKNSNKMLNQSYESKINKVNSYEELEIKLNKEILNLVSAEKIRENERINILNKENDLEKKKHLVKFFTQERLNISNKLLYKQK